MKKVVAVTAAMPTGTGQRFAHMFPRIGSSMGGLQKNMR